MQTDWMTEENAEDLALRVQRFWARQGFFVRTHIVQQSVKNASVFGVRSDMINGMPLMKIPASVRPSL